MKYYAAIRMEAMVHIAWTKYNPDEYVQVDLTRDVVFQQYQDLPELVLFKDAKEASDYAEKQYYARTPRDQSGFFKENPIQISKDQKLLSIYGNEMVRMQKMPVTIVYQLEVSDPLLTPITKAAGTSESYVAYEVNANDKAKLTLEFAIVAGMALFLSDEIAKQEKSPTTVNLVDHAARSAKAGCTIM